MGAVWWAVCPTLCSKEGSGRPHRMCERRGNVAEPVHNGKLFDNRQAGYAGGSFCSAAVVRPNSRSAVSAAEASLSDSNVSRDLSDLMAVAAVHVW